MSWLPPLVDLHTPDGNSYLWYKLIPGVFDLTYESCGTDEIGKPPEWMEHEDLDLDMMLGVTWAQSQHKGHDFTEGWILWALEHSIAPGTPFLVRMGKPHYYRCSYEYVEYDVEYDVEVVRALPRTSKQSLKTWDRFLKGLIKGRDLHCEALADYKQRRETDESALNVKIDWYYPGHYDEMTPPTGISVELWSSHKLYGTKIGWALGYQLASGRSDKGDYREALLSLLRHCAKSLPALSARAIVGAAQKARRIEFTRAELINFDLVV